MNMISLKRDSKGCSIVKKTIEYTVKREIISIDITDELCAYQELSYIGDTLNGKREGITEKDTLNEVIGNTGIKNSKYALCSSEILSKLKTTLLFRDYSDIDKFIIETPYSYVSENGLKDVSILHISTYDHNIYDLQGKKQPKAIYFDYISANVTNDRYDLKKGLEILRNRDDISLCTDEIQDIPYYNSEVHRDKFLEFIWKPADEDFEKICDIDNSFVRYEYIITKILGIPVIE